MLPQAPPPPSRNSTKVGLLIAFLFHAVIVLALLYFAAREGLLGQQLRKITVEMVKEKPAETPKPPAPKPEPPRVLAPPKVEPPKTEPRLSPTVAPAPAPVAGPSAPPFAPPAAEAPAFEFDGGKAVQTSSDPVQLYKSMIESTLRSKWRRPTDLADDNFVAEIEVSVDPHGRVTEPVWKRSSGDSRWDESVRQALAKTATLDRPPPPSFPPRVVVRFDVQDDTEPIAISNP